MGLSGRPAGVMRGGVRRNANSGSRQTHTRTVTRHSSGQRGLQTTARCRAAASLSSASLGRGGDVGTFTRSPRNTHAHHQQPLGGSAAAAAAAAAAEYRHCTRKLSEDAGYLPTGWQGKQASAKFGENNLRQRNGVATARQTTEQRVELRRRR